MTGKRRHLVEHGLPGRGTARCWLELPARVWVAELRERGEETRVFRSPNRNEAVGWLLAYASGGKAELPNSFCVPAFLFRPELHEDLLSPEERESRTA